MSRLLLLVLLAGCDPTLMTTSARDGGKAPLPPASDAGPVAPPMNDASRPPPIGDAAPPPPASDGGLPLPDAAMPPPDAARPHVRPGSACVCDSDCEGDERNAGLCVAGVCMYRGSTTCSGAGSTAECPSGSRCWNDNRTATPICWPDCASFSCAGMCDSDGSCAPSTSTSCDPACGSYCGSGGSDAGTPDASPPPPPVDAGPPGSCPSWECTGASCSELIAMPGSYDASSAQAIADGYYIATESRYAFLRRDLTMLIRYAACEVAHRYPGGRPIGLSDLSQADGRTPGTDVGSPRHPTTTHTGNDMDLAYYQTDGANEPQIICGDGSDRNGNGSPGTYNDGYFCTTETNIVDWARQAYWFAKLASTPLVRVFGVDQTLDDDFRRELDALYSSGAITEGERTRALILGVGASGGWQYHHHHSHMSYSRP